MQKVPVDVVREYFTGREEEQELFDCLPGKREGCAGGEDGCV